MNLHSFFLGLSWDHTNEEVWLPIFQQREVDGLPLKVYGESIVFEHGEATFSRNAGACIDHAHLHIVPTDADLAQFLLDITFTQIDHPELWGQLGSESGYLYFENQRSEASFAHVDRCEQQFFRRKLAQVTKSGMPWNWRDYIRYADELHTRAKIENCITRLASPLAQSWARRSVLKESY
jgi:hypothetical protein